MSSENFVNAMSKGNNLEAEQAFKDAITQKVGDALEIKRKEVANNLVKSHIPEVEDDAKKV